MQDPETPILEHYTSLSEHYRFQLSTIAAAYLGLAQLLFLPSTTDLVNSVKHGLGEAAISSALFFTLLVLGVLHNAASLATASRLRFNSLRSIRFRTLPASPPSATGANQDYLTWSRAQEAKQVDVHSHYRWSLLFLFGLSLLIFFATVYKYYSLFQNLLTPFYHSCFGAILVMQCFAIAYYFKVIWIRSRTYLSSRHAYNVVASSHTQKEALSRLTG